MYSLLLEIYKFSVILLTLEKFIYQFGTFC